MTYHLKAIFPFSGILALESISSDISTFHISRDLCNFFHCCMSNVRPGFYLNQEGKKGGGGDPNLLKMKSYPKEHY